METASCKKVMHIRAAQVSRGHKIMFKNTQEKGELIRSSVFYTQLFKKFPLYLLTALQPHVQLIRHIIQKYYWKTFF